MSDFLPPHAAVSLVGRDSELAILRHQLDAALGGRGGLVLISGEAGIGKTALAEALCREAVEQGALVRVGRCYELSETPPYGPWADLFAYANIPDSVALPAALMGRAAIRGVVSQSLLFRQVWDFFADLAARRPVMLLLDDLQWADSASLELMRAISRDLAAAALLVVATYRDDGSAQALGDLLPVLIRESRAVRLDIRPLDAADIDALVARHYPLSDADRARLVGHLYARAAGNPLFTTQILHALVAERIIDQAQGRWCVGDLESITLPDTVRRLVAARVARVRPATREILQAAAILGDHGDLDLTRAVSRLSRPVFLKALDEAIEARLLRVFGDRCAIAHPLIREAIYASLLPPLRASLHLRAAVAIERTSAQHLLSTAAAVAGHYQRAGGDAYADKVEEYSIRAAQAATTVFAHDAAATHYRVALARIPSDDVARRCDVLLELGTALIPAGKPRHIVDEIAPEALELAQQLGDDRRAWRACQIALESVMALGASAAMDTPMHRVWVERADRYAAPGTAARVQADRDLARVRWAMGREGEAWALSDRALRLALTLGDAEMRFLAAWHVLDTPWAPRHWRDRLTLAEETAGWDRVGIEPRTVMQWLAPCGRIFLDWGMRARAEDLWYERDGIAERTGDAQFLVIPSMYRAIRALLDGHLYRALEHSARLIAESTERGMAIRGQQFASIINARVLIHLGRHDEATAAIPTARRLAERELPSVVGVGSLYAGRLALAHAHAGREREARALLQMFLKEGDIGTSADDTEAPALSVIYFLETATILRDCAAASALAGPLQLLAACATTDMALTCVARHLGAAAALGGDRDAACACYARALDVARGVGFRPEMALTRLQWAEILLMDSARGTDSRAHARELLRDAISELRDMRMQPALDRALRAMAKLAPHAAPAEDGAERDRLTPREQEVLRLLASGSTNKEMARHLSLSTRTVERHIANIYAKIGAHGRADATAYALRHGLDPL